MCIWIIIVIVREGYTGGLCGYAVDQKILQTQCGFLYEISNTKIVRFIHVTFHRPLIDVTI